MECLTRNQIIDDLGASLDSYRERIEAVACVSIIAELFRDLDTFFDKAREADALARFRIACREHPLHALLMQDPFTRRVFEKPGGCADDPVALDYIYRPVSPELSELGEVVHFMTASAGLAKSFVWRQEHLGRYITKAVRSVRHASILSLGCGHLRELDLVRYLHEHIGFQIVVVDEDCTALQEAVNANPDFNVRPVNTSIDQFLAEAADQKYDLIYSPRLLDEVDGRAAVDVVARLAGMLAPEGQLILWSWTPEAFGRGYMDGMMDWQKVLRREAEIEALAPPALRRGVYRDKLGNVVYLRVTNEPVAAPPSQS